MTLTPVSVATLRAMLAHLSPDMPRDEWAAVAMALKSELPDAEGFDLFDAWSQRGEKYRAADTRSTWRSVKAGGGVTVGTLVHMARAAGWQPDAVQTPAQGPSPADVAAAAAARREAAEAERERQQAQQRTRAEHARELWALASQTGAAPYLTHKGLSGPHGARFAPGGVLRVPMRDGAGDLWNVQDIAPDGAKLYAAGKGGRKAGLFHLIGEPAAAPVLLVGEGFATCATAHEATGRPVAVAFDAGNLSPVARELHRLHPAALVLVLADNDRDTEVSTGRNPGREGAQKAARAVRGAVAWPGAADLPDGGSDWNDAAALVGRERVAELIEAAVSAALTQRASKEAPAKAARSGPATGSDAATHAPSRENAPKGQEGAAPGRPDDGADEHDPFTLDERGVWFQGFDMQGRPRPPMRVCEPLHVTARTRLRNGAGWGFLLEFGDPEGTPKEWVINTAALQGDGVRYREALADLGLHIEPGRGAREKLAQYIQSRRVQTFARLVERAGWHGRLYILPGRAFGATDERVLLSPEATAEHPFKQRGSLDKWRATIGRMCEGNTRLAFAVSAAFAGPLLRLAGLQSGGLHFVGPSSRGKSTMLVAAGSVLGSPEMKRQWRSTDSSVEYLAQLHSDSLLILDELKQCDPKIVGEAVYMLGNGTGRNRAKAQGGLRPTPAWAVLFLSSGELTLEAHMAQARMQPMEGQRVRMPAIPAEPEGFTGTVFETNHEHEGGAALSKYIEQQAALNYGHAGLAFLEYVTRDFDAVRERLREGMGAFRLAHLKEWADGQVGRIADRFALVAVAGELATEYGLTGWPQGWATRAAVACFHGMVKLRPGGFGSGEEASMLRQARTYFAEHGEDRFGDWERAENDDSHRPNTQQRAGWRKTTKDAAGDAAETTWYVLPDVFAKQVCEGGDREAMLRLLRDRGHLMPDKGRPFDHSARLPGIGKTRCYRIKSSILDDSGED
jgi:putative DNA primase/helicase